MVNSFINSQFSYSPLIKMFTSKSCNKRIDRIHELLLRLILNDYESRFYDMRENNSPTPLKRFINRSI